LRVSFARRAVNSATPAALADRPTIPVSASVAKNTGFQSGKFLFLNFIVLSVAMIFSLVFPNDAVQSAEGRFLSLSKENKNGPITPGGAVQR
jgi:hypothetical protein